MNTTVFKTLLLREWMQHRRGWLILTVLPLALMLLVVSFGKVELGEQMGGGVEMATTLAGMLGLGALAATLALVWLAVLLQSPGLARRDVQDRSVEFWLSLPTASAASIGSMLLAHLLLVPLMAVVVGLVAATLVGPLAVIKVLGFTALASVDWGLLALTGLALGLRLLAGIVLFTLWLSPLLLGLMAASVWLKRWGAPATIGALAVGGGLEKLVLGSDVVYTTVAWLFNEAAVSLIGASHAEGSRGIVINDPSEIVGLLPQAIDWCWSDFLAALNNLVHPGFAAALATGGAMFWLLVLRRQRGT